MNSKASLALNDDRMIDPRQFRDILGHFPTGVVAVTAADIEGRPASFRTSRRPHFRKFGPPSGSVQLYRDRTNRTCVATCPARAATIRQRRMGSITIGNALFLGFLVGIDCKIAAVHDAGDHHIVVGRVDHLELDTPESPLIVVQGRYGGIVSAKTHA
ncbi:flavin reductase family protein [Rhodococcus sp. NPDC057014]|uniref:flavin reductase family protein n=1 Tax=Rhodococcus sp. NPDC057014 TaxID=3346000 RepID=UPI003625426F